MMFIMMLVSSSILAASASSWFMAWISLEINMVSLLALFLHSKSPRVAESTLKYFLIQTLASAVLVSSAIFAMMADSSFSLISSQINLILSISLLIKLGAAPFHLWVPQVLEGLSWKYIFIVLTWQKFAPFLLLLSCLQTNLTKGLMKFSLILSLILGSILGLAYSSLRKILAFSSINHMGWLLSSLLMKFSSWILYFILYSMILGLLIFILNSNNTISLSNTMNSLNTMSQISFYTLILSFSGLPPFIGFAPKWLVINDLMINSSFLIAMILTLSSLITLFFYLRIIFNSLLQKYNLMYLPSNKSKITSFVMWFNLSGLMIIPILFLLL
uniref:NADH-ubiquinone oxidoreductase chain 2 n=1 Tax=Cypridopsis vidua TaxID=230730 RepID=A0A0N7ATG9_9CRUS|nr:NADH dehydrogenase subunit 2 [Cypridopsis vidua]AJY78613.1 NADH dehydrogenase subunit 2 [Cypridopsis vidua]